MEKIALSGMTLQELQQIVAEENLPRFTAKQIASWLYEKQISSLDEMTNLSKNARKQLAEHYIVGRRAPLECAESADGTRKYLFPTQAGECVEAVFIPSDERGTLCVSSQVGCKMGCRFCMTGRQKFGGQLTVADILNQIYALPEFNKLTNIVFMGQGEPMDNVDAVLKACQLLTSAYGLAWSPRRITVSTVGIRAGLKRLLEESEVNVAISLHFPTTSQRSEWMPAERAFPIKEIVEMLRGYEFCRNLERGEERQGSHQRRLSFEYIVFRGVNDTQEHAHHLLSLLQGLDCRVNLIPFHAIPDSPLRGSGAEQMKKLRDYLTNHGLLATLRASRGQDIMAACGLLHNARQSHGATAQR